MNQPIVAGRPAAPGRQTRILPPARYRHPGDVIRLLAAGLVFAGAAAATLATHGTYAGASATAVTVLRLATTAGRALAGLMTAAFVVAAVAAIATTLLCRRFRLLAGLAGGAARTREAAAVASGRGQEPELARVQRVRPRTLFTIAVAAAAFYFLLPKLAQVGSSWQGVLSADWAWLPLIIAMSAATYVASAVALMGAVPQRLPGWPTVLTQAASSFVNRVSPANVGPGFILIGAVYMGAAALAAVAPTPGGLGAIEAALVAGLTGAGMSSGLAVSAVLLDRIATYWLPVAPGWVALRLLQRWDYV